MKSNYLLYFPQLRRSVADAPHTRGEYRDAASRLRGK